MKTPIGLYCVLCGAMFCLAEEEVIDALRGTDEQIYAVLVDRAEKRACLPYAAPDESMPQALAGLNYDTYRKILYRRDHAIWANSALPFQVQFYHRGATHRQRVAVTFLNGDQADRLAFSPRMFEYLPEIRPQIDPQALSSELGVAGLRVLNPINEPDKFDEIISFLNASYFRALGAAQAYGASARGVAINTAIDEPEEFPLFDAFWIRRPAPDDQSMTLWASLEGPSVSGVYQFIVRPGLTTHIDVRATLVFRRAVRKLGLAPLTSMFLNGEESPHRYDPRRPEIHDSDGLLIAMPNGQWTWHPLHNPDHIVITRYAADHPQGFGLVQRDQRFEHYQDPEANYDRRPSLWVQPLNDWGPGQVELVELPTDNEWTDNIVAFWSPRVAVGAGYKLELNYRLHFTRDDPQHDPRDVWRRPGALE